MHAGPGDYGTKADEKTEAFLIKGREQVERALHLGCKRIQEGSLIERPDRTRHIDGRSMQNSSYLP